MLCFLCLSFLMSFFFSLPCSLSFPVFLAECLGLKLNLFLFPLLDLLSIGCCLIISHLHPGRGWDGWGGDGGSLAGNCPAALPPGPERGGAGTGAPRAAAAPRTQDNPHHPGRWRGTPLTPWEASPPARRVTTVMGEVAAGIAYITLGVLPSVLQPVRCRVRI